MIGPELLRELSDAGKAMLSGAMITLVYDLLRIFRRIVRHGRLWMDLEDALFWGWTSLWIFGVLYRINDGAFRIYTIVMMFLGMLGYHRYIGELLVAVVSGGLKRVLKILGMPLKKFKTYLIFLMNIVNFTIDYIRLKPKRKTFLMWQKTYCQKCRLTSMKRLRFLSD